MELASIRERDQRRHRGDSAPRSPPKTEPCCRRVNNKKERHCFIRFRDGRRRRRRLPSRSIIASLDCWSCLGCIYHFSGRLWAQLRLASTMTTTRWGPVLSLVSDCEPICKIWESQKNRPVPAGPDSGRTGACEGHSNDSGIHCDPSIRTDFVFIKKFVYFALPQVLRLLGSTNHLGTKRIGPRMGPLHTILGRWKQGISVFMMNRGPPFLN